MAGPYPLDFGSANAGGAPAFTTFIRTDTKTAVAAPAITEAPTGDGLYFFDFDWASTDATEITYKALLNGAELFGQITVNGVAGPTAIPAAAVDIVNLALDHLYVIRKIASIDEASVEAQAAKRWYDTLRVSLLRAHPFEFASRRVVLTEDAVAANGHPEWAYAFQMPASYLKGQGFAIYRGRGTPSEWVVEFAVKSLPDGSAKRIYSDYYPSAQDRFVYTADETDIAHMSEEFKLALSYALAVKLQRPLAVSKDIAKDVAREWIGAWNDATAADATERHIAPQEASWILARL